MYLQGDDDLLLIYDGGSWKSNRKNNTELIVMSDAHLVWDAEEMEVVGDG